MNNVSIQKTVRGIKTVKMYTVQSYVKARLLIGTLGWRFYFGYRAVVDYLYDLAVRGGRSAVRIPQSLWSRLGELASRSPEITSKADAAQRGFNNHPELVKAWRRIGADGEIHHFVQQHSYNVSKFGERPIYSMANSAPIAPHLHSLINAFQMRSTETLGLTQYGNYSHLYEYIRTLSWEMQFRWGVEMYNHVVQHQSMAGFDPASFGL